MILRNPSNGARTDSAQQPGGTAFNTRIAGVKHQFTLSAHNLQSIQKELSRFAHAINHTSNQIGIDNKYYQEFLNGGIAAVAQALTQFSHDNDAKALQTTLNGSLADIIGGANQDIPTRRRFIKRCLIKAPTHTRLTCSHVMAMPNMPP